MSEITSPEQVYRCEIENNLSKFIERVDLEQIAIILHVFDIDIFHKLLKKLICLNHVNFKLYISSSVDKIDIITELLNKYHLEDYMIFKTKNLGEDIRPFLKVLPEVMKNKHKVIMKIYAQKEDGVNETESYLSHLYNFLLANDNIKVLLKNLLTFDDVGMIGPEEFVRSVDEFMFNKSETVFDLASKLGVSREEALSSKFVAGRMFICKSDVLSPLLKLSFSDKDFEKDKREIDGGLVHGLERVLGICLVRSNNQILSLPMGKFKA
jgi:lipopolysaccharide biosynthesis protein